MAFMFLRTYHSHTTGTQTGTWNNSALKQNENKNTLNSQNIATARHYHEIFVLVWSTFVSRYLSYLVDQPVWLIVFWLRQLWAEIISPPRRHRAPNRPTVRQQQPGRRQKSRCACQKNEVALISREETDCTLCHACKPLAVNYFGEFSETIKDSNPNCRADVYNHDSSTFLDR